MTDTTPAPVPTDALDQMLCFDLYAASRAVTAAYRPILEPYGLTYPQYLVLRLLWSDGPRPIRHLADRLRLDHATLTPLLRRMEAGGLVTRGRSATDERSVIITPTARATAIGDHIEQIDCEIAATLGLGGAEVADLQRLLRRIEANARSATSRHPGRRGPS